MRHLKLSLAAATAALALSGCVIAPYPGGRMVYNDSAYDQELAVTGVAPPPPYAEVVPAIPYAGAIWLGGYWGWSGGRHAWVGGHWDRPRPGYGWAPHRWVQSGGQWRLHGGGWVRR